MSRAMLLSAAPPMWDIGNQLHAMGVITPDFGTDGSLNDWRLVFTVQGAAIFMRDMGWLVTQNDMVSIAQALGSMMIIPGFGEPPITTDEWAGAFSSVGFSTPAPSPSPTPAPSPGPAPAPAPGTVDSPIGSPLQQLQATGNVSSSSAATGAVPRGYSPQPYDALPYGPASDVDPDASGLNPALPLDEAAASAARSHRMLWLALAAGFLIIRRMG